MRCHPRCLHNFLVGSHGPYAPPKLPKTASRHCFSLRLRQKNGRCARQGRRAGRGRETDGVSAATWPDQGGSVTWLPKVCSALLPALLPLVIAFRRLEPNGHTGPQVTAVGCLAASDHCCGQDIPAIGIWHQHSPAKALFAGFRFRNKLPRRMHAFARINTDVNHFCLCRSDTTYASKVSCINDTPSMQISGVR